MKTFNSDSEIPLWKQKANRITKITCSQIYSTCPTCLRVFGRINAVFCSNECRDFYSNEEMKEQLRMSK